MCFTTSLEYGAAIACPFVLRYRITYPLCIRFCLRIGDYCLVNSLLDSAPPRGAGKMHTTSSSRHNNSSNNNQHEGLPAPPPVDVSFLPPCLCGVSSGAIQKKSRRPFGSMVHVADLDCCNEAREREARAFFVLVFNGGKKNRYS